MADEPNKDPEAAPEQPEQPAEEPQQEPEQPAEEQPVKNPAEPEPLKTVEPEEGAKKGYGKRPWWHWLLIYVAVGAVVYGVIYFVLVYAGGDGGNDTGLQY